MKEATISNEPVVKEVLLDAPVSRVWKAITDRDEMKHWYFDVDKFEAVPGFEFQFTGGTDENTYLHLCRVTEVIPEKKLSYTWKYDGYPGESEVTIVLTSEGNKTRLKLTHTGLETFPQENKDFAKQNFNQGWESIIGKSIKEYIEKNP